jgi:hypothetical protein
MNLKTNFSYLLILRKHLENKLINAGFITTYVYVRKMDRRMTIHIKWMKITPPPNGIN